jgi:hypothetical protein
MFVIEVSLYWFYYVPYFIWLYQYTSLIKGYTCKTCCFERVISLIGSSYTILPRLSGCVSSYVHMRRRGGGDVLWGRLVFGDEFRASSKHQAAASHACIFCAQKCMPALWSRSSAGMLGVYMAAEGRHTMQVINRKHTLLIWNFCLPSSVRPSCNPAPCAHRNWDPSVVLAFFITFLLALSACLFLLLLLQS